MSIIWNISFLLFFWLDGNYIFICRDMVYGYRHSFTYFETLDIHVTYSFILIICVFCSFKIVTRVLLFCVLNVILKSSLTSWYFYNSILLLESSGRFANSKESPLTFFVSKSSNEESLPALGEAMRRKCQTLTE